LASLPERASATAWQAESFVPVARSIVQAVRELRLQDVRWFLHQLDLSKNGPKTDDNAAANNVPPTPSGDALSPTGALSPLSPAGGSSSPAVVWPAHLRSPSPLLSSLPLGAGALNLPSSSPYIMDTLFDAIVGLQAQRALATARETKRDNRRRAREQGVPLELIDLLTPLPSVASSSSSSSSSGGCHTVIDPFCGSGSVLAMANARGLHSFGVDHSRSRARQAAELQPQRVVDELAQDAQAHEAAHNDLFGEGSGAAVETDPSVSPSASPSPSPAAGTSAGAAAASGPFRTAEEIARRTARKERKEARKALGLTQKQQQQEDKRQAQLKQQQQQQ